MPWTRLTARWTGFTGAPGYTRQRFVGELDAAGCATAAGNMRSLLNPLATYLPTGASITWTGTAEIFGDDGLIQGTVPYTPPTAVSGGSTTAYAGGSGACITWHTGSYRNGREIRGRTFLVPLAGAFQTDGTLSATVLSLIQGAATTYVGTTPSPVVVSGEGAPPGKPIGYATMTTATVPDLSAILKSRRT